MGSAVLPEDEQRLRKHAKGMTMIRQFKQTALGKKLYRFSRRSHFGGPLRALARVLQSAPLDTAHLHPSHRAHNQRQRDILASFESRRRT